MIETEAYRYLDEKDYPDCYVPSLLNTLIDPSKPDDEFQKLRTENRILMKTSVGNQANPVDTAVDIEVCQGKLVFIVPPPAVLLKMTTGEALELMKKRVDEFMLQYSRIKKQ